MRSPLEPLPASFFSTQTTQSKQREVVVKDGLLHVTKNHKKRSPEPALPGIDMLSALFFLAPCTKKMQIHTGRDAYDFRLLGSPKISGRKQGATSCRYDVHHEEDRDFKLQINYEQVAQALVPARIEISGPLNGYLVLAPEGNSDSATSGPQK